VTTFVGEPGTEKAEVMRQGEFELWVRERRVRVAGRRLLLTPREFDVLEALARRAGRVVQRGELYDVVWGGAMPYRDRSVDVFVRKVRLKLAIARPGLEYIHTHYGFGYRLTGDGHTQIAKS
jgi:DNA-binding response OmpR family regulator